MSKIVFLYKFYSKEILTKKNMIVFFIFLIILFLFSFYSINIDFDLTLFDFVYKDYLNIYYESVIRLVLIINSILIPIILISDLKLESITLNIMLTKETSPLSLILAKNINILKIVIYFVSIEFIIISFIPIFLYPKFKINYGIIALYLYLILFSISIIEVEFLLIYIIRNYFVLAIPIVIVFISLMIESNITSTYILNFLYDKTFLDYSKELITLTIFDFASFSILISLNEYLFRYN